MTLVSLIFILTYTHQKRIRSRGSRKTVRHISDILCTRTEGQSSCRETPRNPRTLRSLRRIRRSNTRNYT